MPLWEDGPSEAARNGVEASFTDWQVVAFAFGTYTSVLFPKIFHAMILKRESLWAVVPFGKNSDRHSQDFRIATVEGIVWQMCLCGLFQSPAWPILIDRFPELRKAGKSLNSITLSRYHPSHEMPLHGDAAEHLKVKLRELSTDPKPKSKLIVRDAGIEIEGLFVSFKKKQADKLSKLFQAMIDSNDFENMGEFGVRNTRYRCSR